MIFGHLLHYSPSIFSGPGLSPLLVHLSSSTCWRESADFFDSLTHPTTLITPLAPLVFHVSSSRAMPDKFQNVHGGELAGIVLTSAWVSLSSLCSASFACWCTVPDSIFGVITTQSFAYYRSFTQDHSYVKFAVSYRGARGIECAFADSESHLQIVFLWYVSLLDGFWQSLICILIGCSKDFNCAYLISLTSLQVQIVVLFRGCVTKTLCTYLLSNYGHSRSLASAIWWALYHHACTMVLYWNGSFKWSIGNPLYSKPQLWVHSPMHAWRIADSATC